MPEGVKIDIRQTGAVGVFLDLRVPLVIPVRIQRGRLDQNELNAVFSTKRAHLLQIIPAGVRKGVIRERTACRHVLCGLYIGAETRLLRAMLTLARLLLDYMPREGGERA